MYTPIWNRGQFVAVDNDGNCIPADAKNRDYAAFLEWLDDQSKTFQQWLADNPAPQPSSEDTRYAQAVQYLRSQWPTMTLKEKAIVTVLKRVADELRDLQ